MPIDIMQPPTGVRLYWAECRKLGHKELKVWVLRAAEGNQQPTGYTLAWDVRRGALLKFAERSPQFSPFTLHTYEPGVCGLR